MQFNGQNVCKFVAHDMDGGRTLKAAATQDQVKDGGLFMRIRSQRG